MGLHIGSIAPDLSVEMREGPRPFRQYLRQSWATFFCPDRKVATLTPQPNE